MDLGEPKRIITVEPEPLKVPVEQPEPAKEPERVPAGPHKDR